VIAVQCQARTGRYGALVAYFFIRITPNPIDLRWRSGYFKRAFSASSFHWNGFDKGVNSPGSNLKSSHCSMTFM
jgi:hypothetical protein